MNYRLPLSLIVVSAVLLLLQIPLLLISSLRADRERSFLEASEEVAQKWGGLQTLIGPALVIPFVVRETDRLESGEIREVSRTAHLTFLPSRLEVSGTLVSETRSRGIFDVIVYEMELEFEGSFARPPLPEWDVAPGDVLWKNAYVSVQVADPKAIQKNVVLEWNDRGVDFQPNPGEFSPGSGIHANLPGPLQEEGRFRFRLAVNGSRGAFFAPIGAQTNLRLGADWPHPSFQGDWLPVEHDVHASGFEAEWSVPALGSNFPRYWSSDSHNRPLTDFPTFGVDLISPVDPYRMIERSLKYELLFLFVPFLVMWMLDMMGRSRLHPIHYGLVGSAVCVFYLLLLSLSEQLHFELAYLLASAGILVLLTGYGCSVLGGVSGGLTLGGISTLLYTFLYVVLRNQDYALLIGSLGLFLILAAVMYLTRHMDWYSLTVRNQKPPQSGF